MADASRVTRGMGETIVAVSSPPGPSLRGVVRISGPLAFEILRRRAGASKVEGSVSGATATDESSKFNRRGVHSVIWSHGSAAMAAAPSHSARRSFRLDLEVYVFLGPQSFTGEDTVELRAPGSPTLLRMLVDDCVEDGARPAEAGEFTRRAFLNGRLDLTQAEAIAELIHARSEAERRTAMGLLQGGLRHRLEA